MQHGATAKVRVGADGYIWQPWVAQLSGNLIFNVANRNTSSTGLDATSNSTGFDQKNNSVQGDVRLSVLPKSRFPFEAFFERSDSRQSGNLGRADNYAFQRFGFSQTYQALQGDRYWASFDRNTQTSDTTGEYRQENLKMELSKQLDKQQSLNVSGNRSVNTREDNGERAMLNLLTARHSFAPDPTFSVESQANITQSDYLLAQGKNQARFMQLNSNAFWRPEDRPLTVTGGIRMFGLTSNSGGDLSTSMRSGNANMGAYYELDKRIRLNGSFNANLSEGGGNRVMTSNQTVGASYQADIVPVYKYNYSKTASVSASNRSGCETAGQQLVLQLSHSLSRNFDMENLGNLGLNVTQSGNVINDTASTAPQTLSHSGSLNWSLPQGQTYLRLSANDTRSIGGIQESVFQMLNFQLSSNQPLSNKSSLNGNLTMQSTRQIVGTNSISGSIPGGSGDFVTTSSADLNYNHQRAFGIPRLRFVSVIRLNGNAFLPILSGPQDMEQKSWENRLDYSIGRTQLTLSERMSVSNGMNNTSIWFTLKRQFGD